MTDPVLSSFFLVALSEMGDKTQLLAFTLSARFKNPWPVMAGIFTATLLNHAFASYAGQWGAGLLPPGSLGFIVGAAFIVFGFWTLQPDKPDEQKRAYKFGPFLTTAVLFFLAEMGDKTQLATVALGARFQSALAVTVGTTAGMMLSDGLAVFLGERAAGKIPMQWIRWVAAGFFFLFGLICLAGGRLDWN